MSNEVSTKVEYKDTLNLPQTTLAMRANAAVRELEIQKFWNKNGIYEKNIAQRNNVNSFILHDGPPYLSSEKIHVGTALNKILKDIVTKSHGSNNKINGVRATVEGLKMLRTREEIASLRGKSVEEI